MNDRKNTCLNFNQNKQILYERVLNGNAAIISTVYY